MPRDSQLIFVGLMFAIAMAVLEMAFTDWKNEAQAHEEERCKDKSPEFKAMMIRAPGEGHNAEWCAQIMKFGSPTWVPQFGNPLGPDKDRGEVR